MKHLTLLLLFSLIAVVLSAVTLPHDTQQHVSVAEAPDAELGGELQLDDSERTFVKSPRKIFPPRRKFPLKKFPIKKFPKKRIPKRKFGKFSKH